MILPPLTRTQKQILFLLYKFRFIKINQFQKLLNHKDSRRIKEWLKDLKEKKYVYALKDEKDVTKPYIYCLDTKARHVLKENEDCDTQFLGRLYKEKTLTQNFINHCLFIVSIYLFFLSRTEKGEELHFLTQQDMKNYDIFPEELPDAYISVESKDETNIYFLDLFDSYRDDKFLPVKRIRQYLTYCENGVWQEKTNSSTFPTILFVLQTERRKKYIYHYGKAKLEKTFEDILLFLTTQDAIKFSSTNINIWENVE